MTHRRSARTWILAALLAAACCGPALAGADSDAVLPKAQDPLWAEADPEARETTSVPDVGALLGRLVLAMLLVLALLVGGVLLLQKYGRRALRLGGGARALRIVDRVALGPKKGVFLVHVGGRYLLLGVGEREVTLLTEMTLWEEPGQGDESFRASFEETSKAAPAARDT